MRKTVAIPREELFHRVWSTPLLKLAREIGVSDAALGKACRRAKIPLPGRGHWNNAGGRTRPELPPPSDPTHERVLFNVLDPDYKPPKLPERTAVALPPVPVPPVLERPHALVQALRVAAKPRTVDKGRVVLPRFGLLNVGVSPSMLDRALRIMDAIVKAAEAAGHSWDVPKEGKAVLMCVGIEVPIKLAELLTYRVVEAKPARPPVGLGGRWASQGHSFPYRELVSTGKLSLEVGRDTSGKNTRRVWQDTPTAPLEEKLPAVLAEIPHVAAAIQAERQRWEEDRLFRARQEQLREENRQNNLRLAAKRQRLTAGLQAAATGYAEAARLRQLCEALETRAKSMSRSDRWRALRVIELARADAERLDPMFGGLEALLALADDLPDGDRGSA